jgi:hypothetical protein
MGVTLSDVWRWQTDAQCTCQFLMLKRKSDLRVILLCSQQSVYLFAIGTRIHTNDVLFFCRDRACIRPFCNMKVSVLHCNPVETFTFRTIN